MALDAPPLLRRRCQLLAKAETTTGTDATPDLASDAGFVVYNPQFRPIIPPTQRPAIDTAENLQAVRGATHAELSFDCDLMGSGGSGTPSWADIFLPACNMELAGATYTCVTSPTQLNTLTIAFSENGRRRTMTGALGDLTIPLQAGQIARIRFTFKGLLAMPDTDVAGDLDSSTPVLPTTVPPRWAQTSANGIIWSVAADGISAGTYAPRVSQAEIKLNNNVVMRQDANSDAGYRSALVVGRDPILTCDPESVLVATFDWSTAHKTSTQAQLRCVLGTSAGNIVTITMPKASIRERPGGERDGIITEGGLVWQANRNGANRDSDFSLAFS